MQLCNHARSLKLLGENWIDQYIGNESYVVDLRNNSNNCSYIQRWWEANYYYGECTSHTIKNKSTVIKLNHYLVYESKISKGQKG